MSQENVEIVRQSIAIESDCNLLTGGAQMGIV
jgi:hypothetical protein